MGRDLILMLLLICAIGGYVITQDARVNHSDKRATAAETTAKRLQVELDEARGNVRIVTRYVDRVKIVREKAEAITREIPVYVTENADARCDVPAGFVSVHNAAAENVPLAESGRDPDAPAPGVALSTVAETVAGNYAICHENAEQLTALQEYVRSWSEASSRD
ncbi:hypothetical protein AB4Y64_09830 [Lysobacter sp. TAF61]|uniref:hypothetical protein n=1 Tax=Lysobacter sp. TAF61 TaxID=3233072 RepID=UPI003F9BA112